MTALNLARLVSRLTIQPMPCRNSRPGPAHAIVPSWTGKIDRTAGLISRRGGSNADAGWGRKLDAVLRVLV
jgi:hypothetical protein